MCIGQFSFLQFLGSFIFGHFWPFFDTFGIFGTLVEIWGILWVLVSYEVTRWIILVVARVHDGFGGFKRGFWGGKVPFSQINISLLADFGCYFGKKRIFGPFSAFRQSVKTAVYGHFSVILAGTGSVYQRGSYYRWPGWSHQVSLTSVQN